MTKIVFDQSTFCIFTEELFSETVDAEETA